MKQILSLFLLLSLFLVSCSQIRDSAGVNRKNIDEFNIFLSASIVEIKNNRLKSERF